MTTAEYLDALRRLDLPPLGAVTSEALGLSIRQLGRIKAGHAEVTPMLEKLLQMYLQHGVSVPIELE